MVITSSFEDLVGKDNDSRDVNEDAKYDNDDSTDDKHCCQAF